MCAVLFFFPACVVKDVDRTATATLAKRLMRLPRKQKVVSSNLTGGFLPRCRDAISIRAAAFPLFQPSMPPPSPPKKRGLGGIEPPTSPTLKENHTTRPKALVVLSPHPTRNGHQPPAARLRPAASPSLCPCGPIG